MHSKSRREVMGAGLKLATCLAAAPALSTHSAVGAMLPEQPVARTAEGNLRGMATARLNIFKGIRYGEDTTGARFRPPVPVRPWTGYRDAMELGSPCFQHNPDTPPWVDPKPESEDCLFLNVWSPRGASKLPVMIWIHGGGWWWGSGGAAMYDGGNLAMRGNVVVVSLNHRLNIFGYAYLGDLSPEFADSANLGQLDLIEALRWVRRNIAAFGGDPDNVTIFGESGGGLKVSSLLAMPQAKGLFHRAIVQSGAIQHFRSKEVATAEAREILDHLGLAPSDVGRLRTMDPARLLAAYDAVMANHPIGQLDDLAFAPVIDAATAPYHPADPAALALTTNVSLLVGTTEEETAWLHSLSGSMPRPADDEAIKQQISAMFNYVSTSEADALLAAYREVMPHADRQHQLIGITSALWMWANAVRQAEFKAQAGGTLPYMYLFSWREPYLDGNWAIHAEDCAFVFDKLDLPDIMQANVNTAAARAKLDPAGMRYRLRDATMAAWTSFARTGDPANPLLPQWPAYTSASRATMRLGGKSELIANPFGDRFRTLVTAA